MIGVIWSFCVTKSADFNSVDTSVLEVYSQKGLDAKTNWRNELNMKAFFKFRLVNSCRQRSRAKVVSIPHPLLAVNCSQRCQVCDMLPVQLGWKADVSAQGDRHSHGELLDWGRQR